MTDRVSLEHLKNNTINEIINYKKTNALSSECESHSINDFMDEAYWGKGINFINDARKKGDYRKLMTTGGHTRIATTKYSPANNNITVMSLVRDDDKYNYYIMLNGKDSKEFITITDDEQVPYLYALISSIDELEMPNERWDGCIPITNIFDCLAILPNEFFGIGDKEDVSKANEVFSQYFPLMLKSFYFGRIAGIQTENSKLRFNDIVKEFADQFSGVYSVFKNDIRNMRGMNSFKTGESDVVKCINNMGIQLEC